MTLPHAAPPPPPHGEAMGPPHTFHETLRNQEELQALQLSSAVVNSLAPGDGGDRLLHAPGLGYGVSDLFDSGEFKYRRADCAEVARDLATDVLASNNPKNEEEAVGLCARAIFEADSGIASAKDRGDINKWVETSLLIAKPFVNEDGDAMLAVAGVGNSRLYIIRNGQPFLLTEDETSARDLRYRGAAAPRIRQVDYIQLTNSLSGAPGGPQLNVEGVVKLEAGDRVVLSTAGMTGRSPDEQLTDADWKKVAAAPTARQAGKCLLQAAKTPKDKTAVVIDVSDPNSHGPEPSAKERRSHRKQKLETRKRYLAHHLHQTWDEKSRAKDQWNIPRLRRDWRSEMQEEQDQVKAELKEMGWRARFKQLGTTAVAATLLDMPKLRPPEPAPVETIGPSPEELSARRRAATGRKYIEAAFSPSFASAWYELHDGSLTGPALEGAKDILRSWVKTSLHIQAKQQPSDETVNRAVQQYFNSDPGTYIQREVATNLSHVRQSTRRMQRAPLDRPGLSDVTSVRVDYSIATQEWKSERHRIAQNLLSLADKHAKLTGEELPASVIYAAVGQDILELELQLGTITLRPEALVRATTSHPRLYGGMPESELEAGEEILQVESDAGRTIPTIDDRFERLTAVKDLMYHVQFLKDHPVFGVHQAETAALESRIHDFRELHGLVSKAGSGH